MARTDWARARRLGERQRQKNQRGAAPLRECDAAAVESAKPQGWAQMLLLLLHGDR